VVRQKTVQPYTQKTCTYAKISSPGKGSSSRQCGTSYASTDKSKAKCSAATVVKTRVVRDVVVSKTLVKTTTGQNITVSDKTLQTALVSDKFVRNDQVKSQSVSTTVTSGLNLTIRDAKGAKVWTGSLSDASKQQTLKAGTYTATLTLTQHGKGGTTTINTVKFTVKAGANTMVDFGRNSVAGADKAKYLDKKYLADNNLQTINKPPITLRPITLAPIQIVKYKTDKVLPAQNLKPIYKCK